MILQISHGLNTLKNSICIYVPAYKIIENYFTSSRGRFRIL